MQRPAAAAHDWSALERDGRAVFRVAFDATAAGRVQWAPAAIADAAFAGMLAWTGQWPAPEFDIASLAGAFYVRRLASGGGFVALQLRPLGPHGGRIPRMPAVDATAEAVADAMEIACEGGVEELLRTICLGRH